eukprot:IDg2795t1
MDFFFTLVVHVIPFEFVTHIVLYDASHKARNQYFDLQLKLNCPFHSFSSTAAHPFSFPYFSLVFSITLHFKCTAFHIKAHYHNTPSSNPPLQHPRPSSSSAQPTTRPVQHELDVPSRKADLASRPPVPEKPEWLEASPLPSASHTPFPPKAQLLQKANTQKKSKPVSSTQVENILRLFDLDPRYGPFVGLTRIERWNRAERFGLAPPPEVRQLLQTGGGMAQRQPCSVVRFDTFTI